MVTRVEHTAPRTWRRAMELLIPIVVVVGYFVLMRYVLPKFGVPT
jgi:hypothetical protein